METPLRTLIVDDEAPARHRLRELLAEEPDVDVVGEATDGPEAVAEIRRTAPDLVFLDVQMPGMDGFEVLREIDVEELPRVIFVTAYDRYAIQAFEAGALDYLLKPFTGARFRKTLNRARRACRQASLDEELRGRVAELVRELPEARRRSRLPVRSSGRVTFLDTGEIDWIEAAGNYVCIHVGDDEHLLRGTLKGLLEKLAADRFLRIHKSAIVNIESIREVLPITHGEYRVILEDGTRLNASRTYSDDLRRALGI